MKKCELKDVIKIIKSGKSPVDTQKWLDMMNVLHESTVYMEMPGQEKIIIIDQDGLAMYRVYLKKPDTNVQAFKFMELMEEARQFEISLLLSISKEEQESLLLEEPSEFLYFVNAEALEVGRVFLL